MAIQEVDETWRYPHQASNEHERKEPLCSRSYLSHVTRLIPTPRISNLQGWSDMYVIRFV